MREERSAAQDQFKPVLIRTHSHKDGFWLFVWNEDAKRWECSGCGEPWA